MLRCDLWCYHKNWTWPRSICEIVLNLKSFTSVALCGLSQNCRRPPYLNHTELLAVNFSGHWIRRQFQSTWAWYQENYFMSCAGVRCVVRLWREDRWGLEFQERRTFGDHLFYLKFFAVVQESGGGVLRLQKVENLRENLREMGEIFKDVGEIFKV